jgi:hypothetical protein
MRRAGVLAVLLAAGCGSQTAEVRPKQPHLPRALAASWARQADSVAAAIAAGDGCTAQSRALSLQHSVILAVNAGRIQRRFLEPLTSGVNELAARIACTAPPAAPAESDSEADGKDKPKPKEEHGKKKGHHKR